MNKYFVAILSLIVISSVNLAQQREVGAVSGKVIDAATKEPIEYANIVLLNVKDTSVVTGMVTNNEGVFNLTGIRPGNYFVDVRFIGYIDKRFQETLKPGNMQIDLGEIPIHPAAIDLQDVVVQGERSPISYQIDKKVIDVSQMETVASGNAADVLENVPSVTVDIDGNVSLRGTTSFTVLIDGRPSVLDPQDALQQIPASAIQNIELITNPSAKYDPEGTSGIINIILKKNKNLGFSGVVNANAGLKDKYGGDFIFELKSEDVSTNLGLDFNRRFFPGSRSEQNRYILPSDVSYLNSNGNMEWGRISFGVRGGIEFSLSDKDVLSFGGRYGNRDNQRNSTANYSEWTTDNPLRQNYFNNTDRKRSGDFYSLNLNYQKKFEKKDHQLYAELFLSGRNSDESTLSSEFENDVQVGGSKTTEVGPSKEFRGKVDYTLPLGEQNKFESGYQGEVNNSEDRTGLYEFNSVSGKYELQSQYNHITDYNRSEHAFYTMYLDNWNNFGIQGGFRTEYTYRKIKISPNNQVFTIDRWDYFPTLHTSYKFEDGQQLMASYTRRIQRPRGWALEPFETWLDANNVRKGNPDLQPELIDSYEFGFQTYFGKDVSFSTELYYRVANNKIERVRSVYSENINLTTFDNIGTDYSLGTELMTIFDPLEFWNVNLMGNLYQYRVEGSLYNNEPFSRKSFNWNTRINNSFKLSKSLQLQFNIRYNSPSVSSQGEWKGFFTTNASVKKDLFDRMISLTLQIRDIFATAKREFTSEGPDFYNYAHFNRESPVVMLNIRLNFNNYKQEREQRQGDNGEGMDTGEDF